MIVVMHRGASAPEIDAVCQRLSNAGFTLHLSQGVERTIIGAVGEKSRATVSGLEALPGVEKVVPILQPYKLAGRDFHQEDTVVNLGNVAIGGNQCQVFAGPCAVESWEQLLEAALVVKESGANILRGGAFKPRSSPYSFQGLEEQGLKLLAKAREATGLKIVTEVLDAANIERIGYYSDILQVGARNMQNFYLLRELAKVDRPVLLKRGMAATVEEWLMAAEYLVSGGNDRVILCERGIRPFETATRNTLDLSAVPVAKQLSHLPVIVDPSHATGKWQLVGPLARAAIAAGADGVMIEVHPHPAMALCDGPQSLTPQNFTALMAELRAVARVMGKQL
ncbi:MAG: 3-deoxy-7-phosphoheptulonate synthase [Heliobacteriaceae bacterium]|nr:3-deoxy-7-phosphoheptulonate synthase [Heliobacteriaceae bacterium]